MVIVIGPEWLTIANGDHRLRMLADQMIWSPLRPRMQEKGD
ncbi:MAG: hypothetical protein OEY03_08265 [Rhizobacter sp.]|nr:hypothetical protein [Rhizobacter sp.]